MSGHDYIPLKPYQLQSVEFSQVISDFDIKMSVLQRIGNAGVTIAVDLALNGSRYFVSDYPREWLDEYSAYYYMTSDPVMRWVYANRNGRILWSDLQKSKILYSDPFGIFKKAAKYNINHGCVMTYKFGNITSMVSLARSDREITLNEMDEAEVIFHSICQEALKTANLVQVEVNTLKLVSEGMSRKEIAEAMFVSEAAIKQRVARCVSKLGAKNTNQAIAIAKTQKFF